MSDHPHLVAELAQGYEGSEEQAKILLRAASTSGADAAKFQLIFADELAASDYQHYDLFRSLELSEAAWLRIADYARALGIEIHFDVFGDRSLSLAVRLGAGIKVHPTDMTNLGLLKQLAEASASTVYLGIGGATRTEILEALKVLRNKSLVLVLGFQGYPTPIAANQLARISQLRESLRCEESVQFGFADHSSPDDLDSFGISAAAVGLGASVIEKHLTLGRSMQMEDYESAFNPDEFRRFRAFIDTVFDACGKPTEDEDFGMAEPEQRYRAAIRRHVVARRDLKKGSRLSSADITLKRTGVQDALDDLRDAYGQTLARDVSQDEALCEDSLQ